MTPFLFETLYLQNWNLVWNIFYINEDVLKYLYLHSTMYCKLKTKIEEFHSRFEYLWTSGSCLDLNLKYTT